MSFIHYLFLGHFEREGEVIRFSKSPSDSAYRPLVRRPLDSEAIKAVLRASQESVADFVFPDEWMIWLEDGYLICDKYTRNPGLIEFVAHLVERTSCDIYDVSAHGVITLNDWLAVTHNYAKP